jgi:hypothetical protein
MAKRADNPWRARRRYAIQSAEAVVAANARSLPVDLNRIGASRSVQRIEFTPLLTDGGLAVRKDGFVIYVRCEIGQGAGLTEQLAEDGTGSSLPATIARRARFTIAHEIAHTFFYDIRRMPPRSKTEVVDGASANKLELTCNQIAGLILLPETLIQRHSARFDFDRPEDLRMLANMALASTQTVVHRFKHLRNVTHPEAILASVSREGSDWVIAAISRHYSLKNVFVDAKVGASIKALINEPRFVLCGGEMCEAHVEYVGHSGKCIMQFTCEGGVVPPRNRSLVVIGRPVPK